MVQNTGYRLVAKLSVLNLVLKMLADRGGRGRTQSLVQKTVPVVLNLVVFFFLADARQNLATCTIYKIQLY